MDRTEDNLVTSQTSYGHHSKGRSWGRSGSLCTRLQEINTAKGCESNAMPRQRIRDVTRLCHGGVDISGSELSSVTHVREKIITRDPSHGLTHVRSFAGDKNPSDSSSLMINLFIQSL